jgi:DUF1009 family protein
MKQANATCLALDAGKCLLLDGLAIVEAANAAGICMVAEKPATQHHAQHVELPKI